MQHRINGLPETSTPNLPSDEALIEAYRDGQAQAFRTLVARYHDELFHYLVRFLGDRAGAEDVFQETFLQVHLSVESFDTDRRFKPWLFTIASNKARDALRRNKRRQVTLLSEPVHGSGGHGDSQATVQIVDLMADGQPQPLESVSNEEVRQAVQEVIHSLPDHLREILLLAYFQQFPYKQIADMLEIPLGTVKSRLHTAVATFARAWQNRMEPPGGDKLGE